MSTPPNNFSVESPRRSRRWIGAVVGLALIGGVAGLLLLRDGGDGGGGPSPKKKRAPTLAKVRFTVVGAGHVLEGKSPGQPVFNAERQAIVTALNDMYQRSFVAAARTKRPAPPEVTQRYTPDALQAFRANRNSLTIGDQARGVARVVPRISRVNLSIYFDGTAKPSFAVASVHFRAQVTTVAGRGAVLEQFATYRFVKSGSTWLIMSFDARLDQEPVGSPSPTPTGSPT